MMEGITSQSLTLFVLASELGQDREGAQDNVHPRSLGQVLLSGAERD